jgi:thiopurine S-methyltransferase
MEPAFWHKRWADNQIGFHESRVHPLLVAHFDALALPRGARVFLPLCGKTLDIDWLLLAGYRVAGAEISSLAVAQLFERSGATPAVERFDGGQRWSAAGLDVFVGDIFDMRAEVLGPVDAVYDRAALIALPPAMRVAYARHLRVLTGGAPQLLVTLDYDQALVDGPPFAVSSAEVQQHFPGTVPRLLASDFQPTGLKGRLPVTESVWKIESDPTGPA